MKVSLDDGKTFQEVTGVRIIQSIPLLWADGDTGDDAELQINLTDEGMILDLWNTMLDDHQGTSSETYEEIAERLLDEKVY